MAKKMPAKDPKTGKFLKSEETAEDVNYKDIKDKSFSDVASDDATEEVAQEEIKDEPKEELKGDPIEVEPTKETEVEFDPKKFKEEVVQEVSSKVSQETANKIAQTLTGKEEATSVEKDKYQKLAEEFEQKHGRPPTWFELIPHIVEDTKASLRQETEKQEAEKKEALKKHEEEEKQRTLAFNQYLDEQLDELHKSGKIDKNNKDQRKALFQAMLTTNQERVKQGMKPIYSIKEIYYEHYTPPTAQPAGDDAPVSAGVRSSGHANDDKDDYGYNEIHKKTFFDMLRGK